MSDAMITRRGGGGSARLQTKTVTPAASASTVTPDSGYDGLSSVTVAAITPQKAAEIYIPSTQDQVIAADRWLAGAQTISGDANLVAANIKKGVSIFNVAGSYEAGLDTNSAILKVVTSTGCSVTVTNGNDYDVEQLDAEGFVRSGDANVTEHFFVIPTAAFGTFTVKSTHPTYGDNEKQNAVVIGNAGQVYEVLCGGVNIILDSTFGLQRGFTFTTAAQSVVDYDPFSKTIIVSRRFYSLTQLFNEDIRIAEYESIRLFRDTEGSTNLHIVLKNPYNAVTIAEGTSPFTGVTAEISNRDYDYAHLFIEGAMTAITNIVLT